MRKQIKPYLLTLVICMAAMAWLTGYTQAWQVISVIGKDQLSVGTANCTLRIFQNGQEVPENVPLAPGEYDLELMSCGDVEGWFVLNLTSAEDGSEQKLCRTEILIPGADIRFRLNLAEAAILTVESRWDFDDENMTVLTEDDIIFWGQIRTGESAQETEAKAPESSESAAE